MKLTKNIFFVFCFLFIAIGINGNNQSPVVKSTTVKVQSAPGQGQIHQANDGLIIFFRSTESTNSFFRNTEQINPFFNVVFNKQFSFSKQSFTSYSIKRLNQLDNYPLYIHHRRFRI